MSRTPAPPGDGRPVAGPETWRSYRWPRRGRGDTGSRPDYGVAVHRDLAVETRDGVDLATDVYRPADDAGEPTAEPRPALLVWTPYDERDRSRVEFQGRWFARGGTSSRCRAAGDATPATGRSTSR
jgi:predicted acyl esterase